MMPTDTQEQEAKALEALLDRLRDEKGVTRAEFAKRRRIPGGASMISQHTGQHRPLSPEQVVAYAEALRDEGIPCLIGDISQRLEDVFRRGAFFLNKYNDQNPARNQQLADMVVREEYGKVSTLPTAKDGNQILPLPGVTMEMLYELSSNQQSLVAATIAEYVNSSKAKHKSPAKKKVAAS